MTFKYDHFHFYFNKNKQQQKFLNKNYKFVQNFHLNTIHISIIKKTWLEC